MIIESAGYGVVCIAFGVSRETYTDSIALFKMGGVFSFFELHILVSLG